MPLQMSTWTIMKNIVAKNGFSGLFTGKNISFTKLLTKMFTFPFKLIAFQQKIFENIPHLLFPPKYLCCKFKIFKYQLLLK